MNTIKIGDKVRINDDAAEKDMYAFPAMRRFNGTTATVVGVGFDECGSFVRVEFDSGYNYYYESKSVTFV